MAKIVNSIVVGLLALAATCLAAPAEARWLGAWGYAPAAPDADNQPLPPGTYRYRATLTQRGDAVILTFSNAEGTLPVTITHAAIAPAVALSGLTVAPGSWRALSFAGHDGATLPIGRAALSDPLRFAADIARDVIVSVTFATPTRPGRTNLGLPMAFAAGLADDGTAADAAFKPLQARPYLSLIAVNAPRPACTVVAFGDSITDGFLALSPVTRGWPGRLAERFATAPPEHRCGVVNTGVSGNRILRDGRGIAALDRFWRDVAAVPGVTHLILLEGINDIGNGGSNGNPSVTAATIIDGYRALVARAHALGIRVIGGTMTPALHAAYMSPAKDRVRKDVNAFVRGGGLFDGVIDFERAVRDPRSPDDLRGTFDPGDHLHPNDAGYRAMGDAIDLSLFAPRRDGHRD